MALGWHTGRRHRKESERLGKWAPKIQRSDEQDARRAWEEQCQDESYACFETEENVCNTYDSSIHLFNWFTVNIMFIILSTFLEL